MKSNKLGSNQISIIGIGVLFFCLFQAESRAQNNTNSLLNKMTNDGADVFEYQLEGRSDPFQPFIKPQVATITSPDEIIDENKKLIGMQLFEPGQLKLVGVMITRETKMAMVEDVTGQGHIIDEGIPIGKYGKVSQIAKDRVIITETKKMRSGKEITTSVVMRLSRAGD